jgi:hypothetical protein
VVGVLAAGKKNEQAKEEYDENTQKNFHYDR